MTKQWLWFFCFLLCLPVQEVLASAWLSVKSDTPTKVFVDDKLVGTTPIVRKAIKGGEHLIRYQNEEVGTQMEFSIQVGQGKQISCQYNVASQENSCIQGTFFSASADGKITLFSKPAATVFIDGQRVGMTPLEGRSLSAGSHKIEFRLEGFESVFETIDVADGEHKKLSVEFKSTEVVE